VVVFTAGIGTSQGAALARITDHARPDLENAIRLYALPRGFAFRGECATVTPDVTAGLCYEASIRADGTAEVYLTDLASGDSAVVLFADGNPGWYAFTRQLVVSGGPGINTAAEWSDVSGNWYAHTSLAGTGYPGLGSAVIHSDGSGSVGAGRFEVAQLQLSALQDGIAVGTLTVVRNNIAPDGVTITSVTAVRSALCAFVVRNDGSAVLTSVLYGENWVFYRQP
jgi:hypothetical protein